MRGLLPLLGLLLLPGTAASPAHRKLPNLLERRPNSVPFQAGERLGYEVNWKPLFLMPPFKAGELALEISKTRFRNRPAFKISAQVSSEGLLASAAGIRVRDRFESIVDGRNFRSYRLLRQVRQNRRKRDLESRFDYAAQVLRFRETNLEEDSPRQVRSKTIQGLEGPVTDVLSVFYLVRLYRLRPGQQFHIDLGDRDRIQPVDLKVETRERVETALGPYPSLRISTVGGLFRGGGNFRVWYSRDRQRLPLRFEADVKFGKVYGSIIRLETPSMSRGVVRVP